MEELTISSINLANQLETIKGTIGLFTDDSIRKDYTVDVSGYENQGTAYYYSRELRSQIINCVKRDTTNLEAVGKAFVDLDKEVIKDE